MNKLRVFQLLAISLILCSGSLYAHHGGASYWIMDQRVGPVTGVATKLGFSFPHVSIFLDIPDENGNVKNHMMSIRWTPTVLRKIGWSRKTIVPGDKLTVTYIQLAIVPASSAHEANVRAEIK